MNYAGSDANMKAFEKMIEAEKAEMLSVLNKQLEPLMEQGRKAYEEYVAAEQRSKDETFSRN